MIASSNEHGPNGLCALGGVGSGGYDRRVRTFDLFSRRQKQHEPSSDPYRYGSVPTQLRAQIVHIWRAAIGTADSSSRIAAWKGINATLCRELGVFSLNGQGDPHSDLTNYFLHASDEAALDVVDLVFHVLDTSLRSDPYFSRFSPLSVDDAITELNQRLNQHNLGYQFVSGALVRRDQGFLHAEATVPAFALLGSPGFSGAADELTRAHDHYRQGRNKEAVTEALKAFESTMKCICERRGWSYDARATAKPLIKQMIERGIVPTSSEAHLNAMQMVMEAGLPTLRNKRSGHGQGSEPQDLEDHVVAYALHLAASNIVFLVECDRLVPVA